MIKAYAAMAARQPLQPFDYDPGPLKADEVEIEVEYCGICHSDLSIIDNEWGVTSYPVVPGHEVVGRVAQLGQGVTHLSEGQRVGLGWHSGYCNHCHLCKSGDANLCATAQPTIVGHHGGFADRVRAQAQSVVALPKELDPAVAGPLFCGGITVFNPLVQFDVKPTDKVAVIGIGGLGHLALQILNAWGCEVTAFTSSERKKQEALKLGAHRTVNSRSEEDIKAAAGQFDLILSTVNVKLEWPLYLSTLRPRGRLHFVGASLDAIDIAPAALIGGQYSVSGSPVGSPATIEAMLEFCVRHDIKPVVESYPMSQVNEALAKLREGNVHYRIVLTRD